MTIRHRLPGACLGLVLFASAFGALAKRSSSRRGAQPFPVAAATREVYINAVVTDRQGNPVKDLIPKDFTVFDNGVPQRITSFSPIDAATVTASARPLAAGVYSNRPADHGAPRSVTVLLLDTRGSPWTSGSYNLGLVRDFLHHIQAQDHVGIYVLDDRLHVIHSFTRDSSDIVAAILSYETSRSSHVRTSTLDVDNSTGYPTLDRALSSPHASMGLQRKDEFFDSSALDALDAIARQLSGIPGRRELVWVTDWVGNAVLAVTSDMEQYLPLWREQSPDAPVAYPGGVKILQAAQLMNNAGIAVYGVNAMPLQKGRVELKPNPNAPPGMSPTASALHSFEMTQVEHSYLTALAKRTGGRSFLKPSKIDTAIQQAISDGRFSYTLAYSPTGVKNWDGEWRHIQIKVDRAGVALLARTGYLALPSDLPSEDHIQLLNSIAETPLEATQLLFSVRIAPVGNAKEAGIDAIVHVPPDSFAEALTAESNGHWTGRLEIVFMQLDKHDHVIGITPKQVNADLPPPKYAEISKNGWDLPVRLIIKPKAQTLCVILHDEASDEVGSIHIPLAPYAQALRSAAARN